MTVAKNTMPPIQTVAARIWSHTQSTVRGHPTSRALRADMSFGGASRRTSGFREPISSASE